MEFRLGFRSALRSVGVAVAVVVLATVVLPPAVAEEMISADPSTLPAGTDLTDYWPRVTLTADVVGHPDDVVVAADTSSFGLASGVDHWNDEAAFVAHFHLRAEAVALGMEKWMCQTLQCNAVGVVEAYNAQGDLIDTVSVPLGAAGTETVVLVDLGVPISWIRAYGSEGISQHDAVIVWMEYEPGPPTVSISSPSDWLNSYQRLRLSAQVTGLLTTEASYVWTSTDFTPEELVDPTIIACAPGKPLLVIRENILSAGQDVDFTLTVTDGVSGLSASATFAVHVNEPPQGGTVEVSPTSGIALETVFTLTAEAWSDDAEYYSFWYRPVGTTNDVPLAPLGLVDTYSGLLPAGDLVVSVRVYDQEGAWAVASTVVSVYDDPVVALDGMVNDVTTLNLDNGISNALDSKLANAVKALEDINDNNNVSAVSKLQAFMNEVQAQAGKKIPTDGAAELIAKAEVIIQLIG